MGSNKRYTSLPFLLHSIRSEHLLLIELTFVVNLNLTDNVIVVSYVPAYATNKQTDLMYKMDQIGGRRESFYLKANTSFTEELRRQYCLDLFLLRFLLDPRQHKL